MGRIATLVDDGVLRLGVVGMNASAVVVGRPDLVAVVILMVVFDVVAVVLLAAVVPLVRILEAVSLLVGKGPQRAVVQRMLVLLGQDSVLVQRQSAIVKRVRMTTRVAVDVSESVHGQSGCVAWSRGCAPQSGGAPTSALRPSRQEEHARGGVQL